MLIATTTLPLYLGQLHVIPTATRKHIIYLQNSTNTRPCKYIQRSIWSHILPWCHLISACSCCTVSTCRNLLPATTATCTSHTAKQMIHHPCTQGLLSWILWLQQVKLCVLYSLWLMWHTLKRCRLDPSYHWWCLAQLSAKTALGRNCCKTVSISSIYYKNASMICTILAWKLPEAASVYYTSKLYQELFSNRSEHKQNS